MGEGEFVKKVIDNSAATDDINLDRQMRALFLKRMSKPSLGEMVGEQVDQQIAAQITQKLVGNLLGGGQVLPNAEPKGFVERIANMFLNSPTGAAVGQTIVDRGLSYLGPTRVGVLADNFIRQREPEYQGVPVEEQKNINKQLFDRYSQGLPAPNFNQPDGFFNQPQLLSDSEWLLSLNPEDPISQQEYMARRGIAGVGAEDVRRMMNRDIEKARKEAMGAGTDIMGSMMPSSQDDGWKESDIGKVGKTSDTNSSSSVNAPESTNSTQVNSKDVTNAPDWQKRMELIIMNLATIMDKNAEEWNKSLNEINARLDRLECFDLAHPEPLESEPVFEPQHPEPVTGQEELDLDMDKPKTFKIKKNK